MLESKEKKTKKLFVEGPIRPSFIAESIAKHSTKKDIGAHQIFLGQIRNDTVNEDMVQAIEFTAYREMAEEAYTQIRETIFEKHKITCMHVYHSLGRIEAGEINLFVFVSSPHRKEATEACRDMVEYMKTELPIWGRIIFENEQHSWKMTTSQINK